MRPVRYTSSKNLYLIYACSWLSGYIFFYFFLKNNPLDEPTTNIGKMLLILYIIAFFAPGLGCLYNIYRYFRHKFFYVEISTLGFTDTRILSSIIPWQYTRDIAQKKPSPFKKFDQHRVEIEVDADYIKQETNETFAKFFKTESKDGWITFAIYQTDFGSSLEDIYNSLIDYSTNALKHHRRATRTADPADQ